MEKVHAMRSEYGIHVKMELLLLGKTSRQLARAAELADSTICDIIAGRNSSEKSKAKIDKILKRWREETKGC